MTDRPTGTVTFLFTDIEGSTQLVRELGDRYARILDEHRGILRGALGRHGGYEVDTQGDAFFYAFGRARDAAAAAAEAQDALARHSWGGLPVRVRMGVHTAEAQPTVEGYVGLGVHRAARICAAAHGGQVLLSETTHRLLDEAWRDGLAAIDLGEWRLKDLAEPQRLYQLTGPTLQQKFPPLRTLAGKGQELPAQSTAFVGRQREVAEVRALLAADDVRLLTLTGPGGTGKTRLALQAAAGSGPDFADGIHFVALASVVEPEVVLPTIAQALSVNEASQTLGAYLAQKELLLVVDNFEQVIDAGALIASLVGAAPRLKVLVTSREPLRVSAERLYPVAPLDLPDLSRPISVESASRCDAVALFVKRAQAVAPGFAITATNARAIAELCVQLDGLPLAIELAAARIRLLTPEQILARLGERLQLLTGGARDAPERQRTLRATIGWSFELLEPGERRAFASLAVFAGGWTIDTAEAVCDVGIDGLTSLADKSLVRQNEGRFSMLETVREFALEWLEAGGDGQDARARHADHFAALAEAAYVGRIDSETAWSARLERDHDNLRAALDYFHVHDRDRERQLAGALGWFWYSHSHFAEGRARLDAVLGDSMGRSALAARALASAGTLAGWQGSLDIAKARLEPATAIWRELGDEVELGLGLESLAWAYFVAGELDRARALGEECLLVTRHAGRPRLVNRALSLVGQVLVAAGDVEHAESLAREALARAVPSDDIWTEHFAQHYLGDCALINGNPLAAIPHYRRSLETAVQLGNVLESTAELQGLAMAAAGIGELSRGLRFAAAADAAQRGLGVDLSGIAFWSALLDRYLRPAREGLGAATADAVWLKGLDLDLQTAIAEALAVSEARGDNAIDT